MNQTTDMEKQILKLANEMPADTVIQMRQTLKTLFNDRNIPYDDSHLKAVLIALLLVHPSIPPANATFLSASIMVMHRLIDEESSGLITSPIQSKKL